MSFSSFSKNAPGMNLRNFVLFKDKSLRKHLNISEGLLKPVFQPVISKSPVKKLPKVVVHRGTSSFHSIPRSHFYSIVIHNQLKKTESNSDFYDISYNAVDKHIPNVNFFKPKSKKIIRNLRNKASLSIEQSSSVLRSLTSVENEKSTESPVQSVEKIVKRTKKPAEGIIKQKQDFLNLPEPSCYSLNKEAIIKKMIELY